MQLLLQPAADGGAQSRCALDPPADEVVDDRPKGARELAIQQSPVIGEGGVSSG